MTCRVVRTQRFLRGTSTGASRSSGLHWIDLLVLRVAFVPCPSGFNFHLTRRPCIITSEKFIPAPSQDQVLSDLLEGLRRFKETVRWKDHF
jgi:hypothetical protein